LFSQEVFEVGAPIAVVAAASDRIADEAPRLIAVDYEVLPAVLDHIEGMKATTPKQWDNKLDDTILDITPPKIRGNPDQGFASSDVVVEDVTTRSAEHHAALGPTTVIAKWDYSSDGRDHATVVGTFRHAHGARNTFSQALNLDQSQVRVITPGFVGASYGSHRHPNLVEIHAAAHGQDHRAAHPNDEHARRGFCFRRAMHRRAADCHTRLSNHQCRLQRHRCVPLLSDAAKTSASPLIRNFGTLGGNINQRPRCWFFRGEDFNCYKKGGDFCYSVTGTIRITPSSAARTCSQKTCTS
jgi:CO/xanthine dehydrogenase Mo-binding subunit